MFIFEKVSSSIACYYFLILLFLLSFYNNDYNRSFHYVAFDGDCLIDGL